MVMTTLEERFSNIRSLAEHTLERLDAVGEWNGLPDKSGGNGSTIHARNLHKGNINYYYKFGTLDALYENERQYSWGKNQTKTQMLDNYMERIEQALSWLQQQVSIRT